MKRVMVRYKVKADKAAENESFIRKVFAETPEKFDPRDYLKPTRNKMKEVCIARMVAFGQAGNASVIKCESIDKFAGFYAAV